MKSEDIGCRPAAARLRSATGLASTAALGLGEGQAQVFGEFGWQGLAMPLLEFRLGIEEIDLAGSALHEHEDDILCLGREVRLTRRERVLLHGGAAAFTLQHLRQRDGADAAGAIPKELAATLNSAELFQVHG